MLRIQKCLASKSRLSHDWVQCVSLICSFVILRRSRWHKCFSTGVPTLHQISPPAKCREDSVVRKWHSVWTPATPCGLETYPALCQLLHPEQRPESTTNLCYGHKWLTDGLAALCQPLIEAAASAICVVALVLTVRKGTTLRVMHGFAVNLFHHLPFSIKFCFLLDSKCHLVHDESQSFDGQVHF